MTPARALALAISAIDAEIHRLAVSANLHELYGLDSPGAVRASKHRAELREAKETLKKMRRDE